MVAFSDFIALSSSSDSEERARGAHLAAICYLEHSGPADEHAALYAILLRLLDDPSVKVRAALAYGLLHSTQAPRAIILALLRDSAVIARAIAQYSPALLDADLLPLVPDAPLPLLLALAQRSHVSERLAGALIGRDVRDAQLLLLRRVDVPVKGDVLLGLAERHGLDPELRGVLLARRDLPADVRLLLVQHAAGALRQARIVCGALHEPRLDRLFRSTQEQAIAAIGETAAAQQNRQFASVLASSRQLNTRLLLHALVSGQVLFLADCLAQLARTRRRKVLTLLETGSRGALQALLGACAVDDPVRGVLIQLIRHARAVDLAEDVASRHYVITVVIEELIAEYEDHIPPELEETFSYLNEQNVRLAREAARDVMAAFAGAAGEASAALPAPRQRLLPAA